MRRISRTRSSSTPPVARRIWKEPGLALILPELLALYPEARAVQVVRDPRDHAGRQARPRRARVAVRAAAFPPPPDFEESMRRAHAAAIAASP